MKKIKKIFLVCIALGSILSGCRSTNEGNISQNRFTSGTDKNINSKIICRIDKISLTSKKEACISAGGNIENPEEEKDNHKVINADKSISISRCKLPNENIVPLTENDCLSIKGKII